MNLPAGRKKVQQAEDTSAKHIIIAAYYFPPLGLAGTARPLAMANYFAARGYVVTVLTVKSIDYPAMDESQLEKVHPGVSVVRAGSADPARIAKIVPVLPKVKKMRKVAKGAVAATLFPDSKVGFVQSAARMLRQLLREDRRNVLITTSPPMSLHKIALDSLESFEFDWIADFRDVWTSIPENQDSPEFARKAKKYRREICKHATSATATSQKTVELLRKSGMKNARLMYNGFAEADFAQRPPKRLSAMGLYGTLNDLIGAEKLFDWFSRWRSSSGSNLKLRHVGYVDWPKLDGALKNFDLKDAFISSGYLPHDEALLEIRRNQVNVMMLSDELDLSYVVPSKLFELLRAEPPLIVILPPGNAARELLVELNLPQVFIVDTYQQFTKAVEACVDTKRDRDATVDEKIAQFEWDRQIAILEAEIKKL